MRHFVGSILGHHRSILISDANDTETGGRTDSRRMGVLERNQFSGHCVVAGGPRKWHATIQMHIHRTLRLFSILVDHIVLFAAAGDGVHILSHLSGGRHSNAITKIRYKASADGIRRIAIDTANTSGRHDTGRSSSASSFAFGDGHLNARRARRGTVVGAAQ